MSISVQHHQALGIHPGAFVQDTAPVTTDLQDGVLWVDTSPSTPPYQLKVWRASMPAWQTVGIVGSGVDDSGALATDCLMFPHGQGICGDVTATLRFLMGDGQDHGMDDTGYALPGGHRLERHSGGPSGAPPPTAGVSLFPSTPTLALTPAPSPPSDLSSVTWGIRFGPLFDGGVVYCMLTSRPDGPSVANPFFRTALYRDNGDGTFTRISYFDLGGLANPGAVILGDSSALPSGQHSWGNQAVSTLFTPGPLGSDVAVDSFHEYILVICSNALWPDMVDPAYTFGSNDYLETPGTTYFAVNSMELTATSFDIVGFAATTPPGQMAADIVYVYPAQPDIVRLVHEGGRIDWQHNSISFQVRSAGVPVLQTPLDVLTTTPTTLVGQDPATNLPAYCPTPISNTEQVLPSIPTTTCTQSKCGSAYAMSLHLQSKYQMWQPILSGIVDLALLGAAATVIFTPELDATIFLWSTSMSAVWAVLKPLLEAGLSTLSGSTFGSITPDQQEQIQQGAFCGLTCDASGVHVTQATLTYWTNYISNHTSFTLDLFKIALLNALVDFTSLAEWQACAAGGGSSDSCDTWGCP